MRWKVEFTKRAAKALRDLPVEIRTRVRALVLDIEASGPVRGNWPNYSKLYRGGHHCHVKGGRPTFVVCWIETLPNTIEVFYVGTHEKAPY